MDFLKEFIPKERMFQEYYEKVFLRNYPPKMPEVSFNSIPIRIPKIKDYKVSGEIKIFGKPFQYYKKNINWHADVFTQKQFPKEFSRSIKLRNKNNISAKAVWRKNRMQFLTILAINYKLKKNPKDLEIFKSTITSWIAQNPYMVGINWYSNLEVNIRLIVWFFCWNILDVEKLMEEDDDFKQFVEKKWLPCIYQHCYYSFQSKSKYSSSNNHLISEYTALFLASSLWKFPKSEMWFQYAKEGLEEEITRQNSPNGINKEEAAGYVQFTADLFLIPFVIGKRINCVFSKEYGSRLRKIVHYIHHFLDVKGNFPKYGDEDDSRCLLFTEDEDFNNFKSIVASGAVLFKDPALPSEEEMDIKNKILMGNRMIKNFEKTGGSEIKPGPAFYEEEGHFVFRSYNSGREIYMHFNAAPLGFLSSASHGHADALSFVLHIDGNPIFVDPGTYSFHTDYDWRKYFMGTLAHNTVKVNLKDQAEIAGPAQWQNPYQTTILDTVLEEDRMVVKAQHDGYKKQGVTHIREVIFEKSKKLIRINDTIKCLNAGFYFVELPFHLHPKAVLKQNNPINFQINDEEGNLLYLIVDKKLKTKIIKGQSKPQILGWYSDSFLQKEPCTTVYSIAAVEYTSSFQTLILIK